MKRLCTLASMLALAFSAPSYAGAQEPGELDLEALFRESIPPSPFADVFYRYADTMIAHGRVASDAGEPGAFHAAIDRETLAPIDRRIGARAPDPVADQDLLRFLWFLEGLSTEKRYPEAADRALEAVVRSAGFAAATLERPCLLWPRCFALAPDASRRAAFASLRVEPSDVRREPQRAGYRVRSWAGAYAQTRDAAFLDAIERVVADSIDSSDAWSKHSSPASLISLAIDGDGASRTVPEPLRSRLRRLAARADQSFLALPHDLRGRRGFVAGEGVATPLWDGGRDGDTTARVAALCVARYENSGKVGYRELILAAADAYLDAELVTDSDVRPGTLGHAITLELTAFRLSADARYYQRAFELGELAVARLFADSPLPRASAGSDHYENSTGAHTLVLALVDLHLTAREITAVRAPANTFDR